MRCRCVRCSCGHSRIIFSYHYCTHSTQLLASKKQKIVPHHVLFCYMCANMPISNFIEEVAFGWKSFRLTWCKAKRLHSHPIAWQCDSNRSHVFKLWCHGIDTKTKDPILPGELLQWQTQQQWKIRNEWLRFSTIDLLWLSFAQFRTQNEIERLERWSAQMMIECVQLESRRLSIFKSFVA